MRDLLLLVIVLGALPVAVARPFWGLVVYSWMAYMQPQRLVWGSLPPVSLIVALATLCGVVLSIGRERVIVFRPQTILLLAFGMWTLVATLSAVQPAQAMYWTVMLCKVLLISLLTTGLAATPSRFRILFGVVAVSLGLLGFKYGLYGILRGGVRIQEGPGGFIIDNNGFALAMNIAIPLLLAIATCEAWRPLRYGAWILAGFSAVTVIFTFSRGGLLTLALVLALVILRSGRPLWMLVLAIAVLGGLAAVSTPEFQWEVTGRAGTISNWKTEPSAMARIREWGVALDVSRDYPLFGVGPNNLQEVRHYYVHDLARFRTTHNSYLQVLVAMGLPGLALFVSTLGVSYFRLSRIRRSSTVEWGRQYASMLQASILAYCVGGTFLDVAYFDLIFQLVGMTVALEVATARASLQLPYIAPPATGKWWLQQPAAKSPSS